MFDLLFAEAKKLRVKENDNLFFYIFIYQYFKNFTTFYETLTTKRVSGSVVERSTKYTGGERSNPSWHARSASSHTASQGVVDLIVVGTARQLNNEKFNCH